MSFNRKYAGLPDLDLAPDIYETPDLTDGASTIPTTTLRTASNVDDDAGDNSDIDRQGINADEARAHFLGATVDAREANFSDSIAAKRKAYKSKNRRRRRHDLGADELDDLSDSEDESVERKLARLRREVEELKDQLATQQSSTESAETAALSKSGTDRTDGVLELSRALDNLYASSRSGPSGSHSAAAVLSQKLASTSTPDSPVSNPAQLDDRKPTNNRPQTPPSPSVTGGGVLAHAASFDGRLALIEAAMGISSSSNPFVNDGISEPDLQPVLPALDHLTSRLATLMNLLVGPNPVSAFPTMGSAPPATTVTTPHLESLSSRVRKLTADTEALAAARKRAVDAAKAAQNARISSTALEPSDMSVSSSSATEVDPAATQRDEQATKIQALYATLPTIQSLHPILPSVLERLRSLRAIHAGAAHASESLDVLEKRQADMAREIEQWREGLRVVEEKMKQGEAALKNNIETVEPWVRDLESRLDRLGTGAYPRDRAPTSPRPPTRSLSYQRKNGLARGLGLDDGNPAYFMKVPFFFLPPPFVQHLMQPGCLTALVDSPRSKIDKLSILGVRSFDNTRSETIQFHTPLTLIVGYNGSGKTTIIECLKYATTGDLPPNSKGGAFIHDPKLCGEKEVLAQVKLSFKATSGAKMVATRSLQLTVKKTTRQQKTLEGQLLMVKDGERTAISSRVAELDQILPQYLGVSKAILDSVIFCHQDESLWPMSEPSVLKKKFDEIFEAMKYTKAIDNIKQLRKKQNEELAKYKIMEQHAKEDKEKADRAEKRSIKLQDEIEALRAETQRLSQEMRRVADLADKAWKESESYSQILGALEGKRIEAKSIQTTLDNLQRHLVELDDSDEWLEANLEQFETKQLQYQQQEESQKENYMEIKEQIENARQKLGLKQAEYGKFENDKANFERQVERRQRMTREIARSHSIRGFDNVADQADVDEFMRRIRKILKEQNQVLERVKREAQSELREAQSSLNQLGQRKSALQESKIAAKRQMALNDRDAASYQAKLNEINVDEGVQAALETNIEDISSHLDQAKERSRSASWDKEIQNINSEIRSLEDESSRLNTELIEATKKAGDLARLDHLRKELKERERSLETMKGAHGERLSKYVKPTWSTETLEQDFHHVLEEESRHVSKAERERDGVSRELEQVEFKLKEAKKALGQRQKELKESVTEIREAIGEEPEEYLEIVKERQIQLDLARKDTEQFAGISTYMKDCLATAKSTKVCRLCQRGFEADRQLQIFINKLEGLVKRNQRNAEDEDIRQLEEDLNTAREAITAYNTWTRLKETEIPSLEKEEEQYVLQQDKLLNQLEEHDQILGEKTEKKKEVEALSKTVSTIVKYDSEIKSIRSQIQELSSKQDDNTGSRTLEDIQEEIAGIGERSRALKKTLSKVTHDKEQALAEINNLELQLRDARSNLDNAKFQLERKADLLTRLAEFKNLNNEQRAAIAKADKDIEDLTPELLKIQAQVDDISQRADARERELQQGISQLSDSVHQLEIANEEIEAYNERGGPTQLERSKRELQTIENEISELESEQATITKEINRISAQLKDSENTKRQYADNLTYRQATRALDKVNAEIEQLAAQNAEVDRSRFKEESERRTREHNALAAKQASKMGEMKSKDDQLMQLLADWDTDYKNAASKYKEAHIKVETTRAAVDDLARYGGALDKAIMKYHGLKMEEINAIVGELWQKTYRGTDVDTILIRSDNENAKGNRSYNYRVCMVKQGAEMDMRGRCSAGQKVLASIIIRLALAECFGVNCGLIALDEPTTNLDRDNIRSLAESLHDIIRTRQQQANFQLIVITHDEEFLRHMQCGDFSDYYYRVSRNERQKSIIERQSIAEVM